MTPTITIETITPEIAAKYLADNEYLADNDGNRKVRKQRVEFYRRQMVAGHWRITGDPIRFNGSHLLDGQHRLHACIKAEVPFTTVVVRGLDPDAMHIIDTGLGRTPGNVFEMEGITNANKAAALVRQVIAYDYDHLFNTSEKSLITRDQLLEFYVEHADEVQASVRRADQVQRHLTGPGAGWGALDFILRSVQADLADEFMEAMVTGAGLEKGDPRLALRNYIAQKSTRGNVRAEVLIAQGITAWNEWVSGVRRDHFKPWIPGRPMPSPLQP